MKTNELTGRKVFFMVASFFLVIIGVNFTMAYMAVTTFPGLEVKNSYVASQSFDVDRAAQRALGWHVDAQHKDGSLQLDIRNSDGDPAKVAALNATVGRPTHTQEDLTLEFTEDGSIYLADVDLAEGLWHIRLVAKSESGIEFRQRIILNLSHNSKSGL